MCVSKMCMLSDLLDQKKSLEKRTYQLMFKILVIFGVPAAIAYFVGQWLDHAQELEPYGSLMALGVSFVFSWAVTIRLYITLDRERKELEAKEEALADETSTKEE